MNINSLTPMIYTNDVQGTVDFYVHILGFECSANVPQWEWARVKLGGADLMICKPNALMQFDKPFFTGSFYINTNDIDAIWDKLNGLTRVCYPIENFDYGMREFAVFDNNGYLLQFGQEINDGEGK